MKKIAVRNLRLCTKDCLCLYVCPTGATDTENSVIDVSKCNGCGICAEACPSGAISMVPVEYPPQQKKSNDVVDFANALAKSKATQEQIARQLLKDADNPHLARLLSAIEKSVRLVNEDLLREAGFMLPQSKNTHDLLSGWVKNPPSEDFPIDAAQKLLNAVMFTKAIHFLQTSPALYANSRHRHLKKSKRLLKPTNMPVLKPKKISRQLFQANRRHATNTPIMLP